MSHIAVIDVETTGINPYRHDRVVEVAVITVRPDGTIDREFTSLVNPERDIGPTSIHGLTTADVISAPRFCEIAGSIMEVLSGCVAVAGHNVRFDHSFLTAEFRRMGEEFPQCPTVCTMRLAGGGSLRACCVDYEIALHTAHSASDDARATAQLLSALLADAPTERADIWRLPPIAWPATLKTTAVPLTRQGASRRQSEPPTFIQRLLTRTHTVFSPDADESGSLAYLALLDQVLEDRNVDEAEGSTLLKVATHWGLDGPRIRDLHAQYLCTLAAAALSDGVVTESERRDLSLVARLLGVEDAGLATTMELAERKLTEVMAGRRICEGGLNRDELVGRRVCFTGECQCCHEDMVITRELAAELAGRAGMSVVESVTKKLDILVVADPLTQSTKAKKARQYGIRIVHEPVFWKTIGVEVR